MGEVKALRSEITIGDYNLLKTLKAWIHAKVESECPGLTSKCWGVPFDLMSLVGRDQFTVCVSPLCISKVADKLLWSHLYFFIFSFNSSLTIALEQKGEWLT